MKIELPKDLVQILKKRVESTKEFPSVEQYVIYIVKQVAKRLSEPVPTAKNSAADEKKVQDRLKALGYLK